MRANNLYKKQSVQTASKEQIMVLLFKKAMDNLKIILQGDWEADHEQQTKLGENTLDIVVDLRQTLNHDAAPELCGQLEELYNYIIARLTMGLAVNQPQPFEESLKVLGPIAEAFTTAVQQASQRAGQ